MKFSILRVNPLLLFSFDDPFTFFNALANKSSNLSIGNTASVPASPTPITLGELKIPPFAYHLN